MKSFLLSLLFVSITSLSFSQETTYGVRAGLNISNLDFKPDPTFRNDHRNGFAFGGFVDWGVSDTFSILTEIQYSAEGAKHEDLNADYIQMPVLLRFSICEKIIIGAGPMISLKTWKKDDAFETFTFSGVAGLEYMITDELFIDARVHYGFGNILDKDLADLEAKTTTLQFGIGMKI